MHNLCMKGEKSVKKSSKKQKKWKIVLDIISYSLSVISLGMSIAAFVISLVQKKEQ